MAPFSWSRWLRALIRRPPVQPFRRRQRRAHLLGLEQLETRLAPATYSWTGAAGNNWNNPGDWLVNGAPGIPVPGSDLVFPGAATNIGNSFNDIPNGPVEYNSLSFSDVSDNPGYVLSGNQIILGDPSIPGSGFISVLPLVPSVDIKLPIQLAGTPGTRQFVTVGGGSTLTIDGALSGTTNADLTKEQQGTLVLTNNNSAFTGPITVDVNGGVLRIANSFALGDTSSGTTIQTNGQLQVADLEGQVVPESLILNGEGPDNRGALVSLAGQNFWGGNIELDSDTTLGALAGNMTIDGVIGDLGAGHNLTKEGPGEITFTQADTYRGSTTVNDGVLDIQNSLALGPGDDMAADGVLVNQSNNTTAKNGTLWIEDPTGVGFTVPKKLLTINGNGASEVQDVVVTGNSGTWTLTFTYDPLGIFPPYPVTVPLPFNATAQQVQTALDGIVNILDEGNIGGLGAFVTVTETISASGTRTYEILFGGTEARIDLPQLIPAAVGGDKAVVSTVRDGNHGALRNVNGNNTWTGNVILGSPIPNNVPPAIGVVETTSLTVSGIVEDPTPPPSVAAPMLLTKLDFGTLIFTSANTYAGGTDIAAGILEIEDSQGLGTGACTVEDGASLALAVDTIPDSVTGAINTLYVTNALTIAGLGASVLGSLVNVSGINVYAGTIAARWKRRLDRRAARSQPDERHGLFPDLQPGGR